MFIGLLPRPVTRQQLTRSNGDDLPPLLHGHYPASSLLQGSPPLSGASVLSASRLEPLVLVWAFYCQAFLCSTWKSRFFAPTRSVAKPARAGAVKVGRDTNLSTSFGLARPYLDSSEHGGTLDAVGDNDQRGARFSGAQINRATSLYSVGSRTRTMMQSYASAAKLRGGGPFFFSAQKP
jgi:hypothetical protein